MRAIENITPCHLLPYCEAVAHGGLAQVLPEWVVPRLPIQAVTTSRLQPLSVKALIDFLATRLVLV